MTTKNERDDLKDLHLLLIVLGVVICSAVSFWAGERKNEVNLKTEKISYPEEISQAKKGDLLIIESVSDSIYLGFYNNN